MAKDFKGHLEPDDPRDQLWGTGGCTWPTMPAYRYRMFAPDPPGLWSWLEASGLLFEADHAPDPIDMTWTAISTLPFYLTSVWMWRHWSVIDQMEWWFIFFNSPFVGPVIEVLNITPDPRACNTTKRIDNSDWDWPPLASPGDELSLWQVTYDEELPPEGWPPE